MPRSKVAASLGGAHALDRGDSVSAPLVVVQVDSEGLLERESLDVRLELRPGVETQLAGELELHVRELHLLSRPAPLA